MRPLSSLAIAGLLALVPFLGAAPMTTADAQAPIPSRWIMVAGHGSVEAPPDSAEISTGVVSEAATARAALDANSAAIRKIIDGLKGAGIDAKDIQTQQFQISPRYRTYKDRGQQIDGYTVHNQLRVKIRSIDRVGEILDQVVTLGANQASSINFIVSDAEKRKDEARKKAIENARHRAGILAQAAGANLGSVLTITEEVVGGPRPPRPMVARSSMSADSVPIEAGSETLTVRVEVAFMLEAAM